MSFVSGCFEFFRNRTTNDFFALLAFEVDRFHTYKVNNTFEVHPLVGEDTLYGVYPDTGEIHLIGGSLRLTSLGRSTARINLQVRSRLDMSEGLRTSITVEQTNKDANVIAIGYAGPDSLNVLKIPNAVAYRFVTARGVDQVSAAKAQTRYLKDQEIALETDAASYEAQVQDFLEKEGIPSIQQAQTTLSTEIQQLEAARRDLQAHALLAGEQRHHAAGRVRIRDRLNPLGRRPRPASERL